MKKNYNKQRNNLYNLRTYFNMSIQMCTLRFIVQLRGEVSIRLQCWRIKQLNKKKMNITLMILKMSLMMDKSYPSLNCFFGGENENFVNACNFLSLNEDNNEFISFLCSDIGQNIMANNSFSIHVESGDIFYSDFNKKENFYNFLLA